MIEPRDDRSRIASAAADALEGAKDRLKDAETLAGFDGFVDSIVHVVARRRQPGPEGYDRLEHMEGFAERVGAAAGRSANIELAVQRIKLGGNGPIMASALRALGAPITYVGNLGTPRMPGEDPEERRALHPVFEEFAASCRDCWSVAPVGLTDAVEFHDGKLMLGKLETLEEVNWESVTEAVGGVKRFTELAQRARLLTACNWTMLHSMNDIWRRLLGDVIPKLDAPGEKRMFVDLADPAKRSDEDLGESLDLLRRINESLPVTLGLNLSESLRVAQVLSVPVEARPGDPMPERLLAGARAVREALGLRCCVVHHREGAAGATEEASERFASAFTRKPAISTGAGDHFNAGYSFAEALRLPIDQCLASAVAVSGSYVRTAESPTLDRLCAFLRELPEPE